MTYSEWIGLFDRCIDEISQATNRQRERAYCTATHIADRLHTFQRVRTHVTILIV